MSVYSINVKISPRNFFPWQKQKIQVEGKDMYCVKRSYHFISGKTCVRELQTGDEIIRILQPRLQNTEFIVETPSKKYMVRRISYWQWECRSGDEYILLNRMGGMKCILSQRGRQLAIMTLGSQMPFMNEPNTHLRVNSEENLHLSIATALIVKSISVHFEPLLGDGQLRPIQAVELA